MSARARYFCVFVMVLIAAAMLIGLANAKTPGHGGKKHGEHTEPPVSVAKSPGDPEAEQPHTNTYISGAAASEAKPVEPETYGTARLALELGGVLLVGAALVKVSASRK